MRAAIVEARTYLRPLNPEGTMFETVEQAADRIIGHQRWLWERAKGGMIFTGSGEKKVWELVPLNASEEAELQELRQLFLDRKITVSGRTRWLGGTEIARTRESSNFNCSFIEIRTVHDVVDALWLLLQGCGVGFKPVPGVLNGFKRPIHDVQVIRTKLGPNDRGPENNAEEYDPKTGVWTIRVGDSAQAWARSIGKLLAGKYDAKRLVLDFSRIRGAGGRLRSYGWISSGDEQIAKAYVAIAKIMSRKAGKLLSAIDILDVLNWLGTILSSRRSAEIAVLAHGDPEWRAFAVAKKDHFADNPQRAQSNNSLMFNTRPTRAELEEVFKLMLDAGGSEPGFINAAAARKRAPWFAGINPCAEILLGDKSFCNLVETALHRFNGDWPGLVRAHWLVARANYRQTCVDLRDSVLQEAWHQLNEYLRLCGAGVTGVVSWEHVNDAAAWKQLNLVAHNGAHGMALQLGMQPPAAVTTIKPSGTQSKTMGIEGLECPEGVHKPLGRFIFNRIRFNIHDPLVAKLAAADYQIEEDPYDETGCLVVMPVEFHGIDFEKVELGGEIVEVNQEPAVSQLERYKLTMENYVDHNTSITISYAPDEVPAIIDWLLANWDLYVGVSFILRTDPTKSATDLGYPYLPQTVVSETTFRGYVERLKPVDLTGLASTTLLDADECQSGVCPVR